MTKGTYESHHLLNLPVGKCASRPSQDILESMTEPIEIEPLLTYEQAYIATYHFIHQFYERDTAKPTSMFFLLSWMALDGPEQSSDPAQWFDWLKSARKAIDMDRSDAFEEHLSQPLTD